MARKRPTTRTQPVPATTLRIIGGRLRGSRLTYNGDPATRPMKERVREATFNLVGPAVKDKHAVDLFAGTGALGLEALSRGAAHSTFIERHRPTAKTLRENIVALGMEDRSHIVTSDTFFWAGGLPEVLRAEIASGSNVHAGEPPWLVFCSPPYALYHEQTDEMLALIETLLKHAPTESLVVVEADSAFDFAKLPEASTWDVRAYHPAVIGIWPRGK